ncbi:hypothetical protein SAMN06265355_107167 [Actinomadura mexicana]|uniref:Haloacid dehalogenase superfamily, subfamily IA, variant 3 with third motif having DD or ED n=1 Tax=Actinomadura mexicana TaxID=134959 RepID=A0A238ZEN8_9ACTN|nr:hypothetical protein SAMN06265355_107167 [Actinomadura mexicana]
MHRLRLRRRDQRVPARGRRLLPEPVEAPPGRLGAARGEVVFVDDREENVRAARMLGIRAVHFTGVPRLRPDLARVAGQPRVRTGRAAGPAGTTGRARPSRRGG